MYHVVWATLLPSSPAARPAGALRRAKLSLKALCFIAPLLRLFYASAWLLNSISYANSVVEPQTDSCFLLHASAIHFYALGVAAAVCASTTRMCVHLYFRIVLLILLLFAAFCCSFLLPSLFSCSYLFSLFSAAAHGQNQQANFLLPAGVVFRVSCAASVGFIFSNSYKYYAVVPKYARKRLLIVELCRKGLVAQATHA